MAPTWVLADYRTSLEQALVTAVDASTWTDALKDEALRLALAEADAQLVYECDFTVTENAWVQDLSGISALREVLAIAYPWQDGADFAAQQQHWRVVADHTIYVEMDAPQAGEVMRVRHTKLHTIQGLDAAAATTVPDRHQTFVVMLAASIACTLRSRQISENPAIPEQALAALGAAARDYRRGAADLLHGVGAGDGVRWPGVGL